MKHWMSVPWLAWMLGVSGCSEVTVADAEAVRNVSQSVAVFDPLPQGFDYTARPRLRQLMVQRAEHVRPEEFLPGWLLDEDFYHLTLDGCPPGEDETSTQYSYAWTVDHFPRGGNRCRETLRFNSRGDYQVRLTISQGANSREYVQKVSVKDILVVALGDSYASGEGAPDVPGYTSGGEWHPPVWTNTACHRSMKAPAAVFARQLEDADPRTSVTFISFACSGASISRNMYNDSKPFAEFYLDEATPEKHRGTGLLGSHAGPESTVWNDAQVDALKSLVGNRKIDALFIGAGGNDMGFSDLLSYCVKGEKLWDFYEGEIRTNGPPGPCNYNAHQSGYPHDQRRFHQERLPGRFDALALELADVDATEVFLTEYPDPTRADNGATCSQALEDAPIAFGVVGGDFGLKLVQEEIEWLRTDLLIPLNQHVRDAAERHQWNFVSGVAAEFAQGHGYCASQANRWMVRFGESIQQQGPQHDKLNTTGVMHPNEEGYKAIARKMYDAYSVTQPELVPDGVMVRGYGTPEVYYIRGQTKFHVPNSEWFEILGLDPQTIRLVPGRVVSAIPTNVTTNGVSVFALYPLY